MSEAQKGVGSNHAVSGLKFRILRPILDMGFAVLLSDVDIVTLQNPFQHLHRDCDVEGMSDGWDNATAYGGILSLLSFYVFQVICSTLPHQQCVKGLMPGLLKPKVCPVYVPCRVQ